MSPKAHNGFTLVEILIVVVILGILSALIVPQFASASESARQVTFISNVQSFGDAAQLFRIDHGHYPEDSSTGVLPTGMDRYIREDDWTAITPIGGRWDCENNDIGGFRCAIGVHFNGQGSTQSPEYMEQIDGTFDNGDLTSGSFRRIASDRYYLIVAE